MRGAADEEFRRRCALERALRDAASAFKRELFEKGEELASLLVCFPTFFCISREASECLFHNCVLALTVCWSDQGYVAEENM